MVTRRSVDLPDTTKPESHFGRRVLVAAAIIVAIVAGVAGWYALRPASPAPAASPTATAAPTALASAPGTGLANGCFAGPSKTVQALLAAQKKAPHTTLGAIELAASFDRWATQYPWPTAAEAKLASSAFAAKTASPLVSDLPAYFASRPSQPSNTTKGETGGVSYVGGRYFINSATANKAVVVLGSKVVENGVASATKARSVTLSLSWESGVWKVLDMSYTMAAQDLFDQGTAFAGGC